MSKDDMEMNWKHAKKKKTKIGSMCRHAKLDGNRFVCDRKINIRGFFLRKSAEAKCKPEKCKIFQKMEVRVIRMRRFK